MHPFASPPRVLLSYTFVFIRQLLLGRDGPASCPLSVLLYTKKQLWPTVTSLTKWLPAILKHPSVVSMVGHLGVVSIELTPRVVVQIIVVAMGSAELSHPLVVHSLNQKDLYRN